MKKRELLIFLVLLLILSATGLLEAKIYLNKGVKLGGSLNRWVGKDVDVDGYEVNFLIAYTGGFFLEVDFDSKFSLQTELLYSQRGHVYKNKDTGLTGKATYYLHYLDIPVLGVYKLNDRVRFQAGPYLGFLLGSVYKWDWNTYVDWQDLDDISSTDLGMIIGSSLVFDQYSVELRYSRGFTQAWDLEDFELKIYNQSINLMIGYMFY